MELVLRLGYRSIHIIACIMFHYCPIIFYCLWVLSIVDGHLSSLNIFSIKNNAAINISLYKILCGHMFLFLLGIYLGMELLDHVATLCLTFGETVRLSKLLPHFTVHQHCMKVHVSPLG